MAGLMIVMVVNHYSETETREIQDIMTEDSIEVVIMKYNHAAYKDMGFESNAGTVEEKVNNEITVLINAYDTLQVIRRSSDGILNYILIEKDSIQGWIPEYSIIEY